MARSVLPRSLRMIRSPPAQVPPPGLPYASTEAGNLPLAPASLALSPPAIAAGTPKPCAGAEVHTTMPSFDGTPSSPAARAGGSGRTISVIKARSTAVRILVMPAAYLIGHGTCDGRARRMEVWPGEPFPLGANYDGRG